MKHGRFDKTTYLAAPHSKTLTIFKSTHITRLLSLQHSLRMTICTNQWRTQKFSWGGFIQWHMVVICFWCAVFVTSQFDVIFMFPNQRFGEIC